MITIFTNVERQWRMLEQAGAALAQRRLLHSGTAVFFFNDSSVWSKEHTAALADSELAVLIWQGPIYPCGIADKALVLLTGRQAAYAFMSLADGSDDRLNGFTQAEVNQIRDYLLCSGSGNYRQLLLWLADKSGCEQCRWQPPQPLPWQGIYQPQADAVLDSTQAYLAGLADPGRPLVGILFSRESWIWQDTAYIDAIIDALDRQGINALTVFALWQDNPDLAAPGVSQAVDVFFRPDGRTLVAAVINTFKVGMTVSRLNRPDFLRELNVPLLQAYNLLRPQAEWAEGVVGMNPVELSVNVVQPEFDGVIHGGVVSAKENDRHGVSRYLPVTERVQALAAKAGKWAGLRTKANADKKVAILFHNYPPSNANIGTAIGLDSPESVALLLRRMAADGYQLERLPADGRELMTELLAGVTNDRRFLSEEQLRRVIGKVSATDYKAWFNNLEPAIKDTLTAEWGLPPGDVFVAGGHLLVPGILNGNVLISVQPPRGFGEDPGKILHSPTCPPPHHYFAFYAWIRDVWQADAVIHVGTHGSLEWLPGKNAGLSRRCYPELALGELPDIYPYYITIVGEGIQAKRRGAACLIGHLCPPLSHADSYEDMAELEALLDEYARCREEQAAGAGPVAEQIEAKIAAMHLDEDLPRGGQPLPDYVLRVHAYLESLKHTQIRVGLHTLGLAPQGEPLTEMLLALTRSANGDIPSLPQLLAAAHGCDYYDLLERSGELLADGRSGAQLIDTVWLQATELVQCLQQAQFSPDAIDAALRLPAFTAWPDSQIAGLRTVLTYITDHLAPSLAAAEREMTNILRALQGEYVEPGPGGAPTNGRADILPTGRNFYGVDPDSLPTPAAWETGKALAEQVISRYISEEGTYPENIGMVFWSDSNMRTNGQCIAEFLYLLGVRPVWQKGSRRISGLEIIDLAELKRPRIDVMARVSGLFRDTLFSAISWLEQATALVAALAEPPEMNFVRKHILADSAEWEADGLDKDAALQQASCRIFGCPPGGYGAGVSALLQEKNWQTLDDIAAVYVRWGGHAYGGEHQGAYLPQAFRKRLGSLDITIKNIDNHEVHLLSSDDFNAYCGGMNAAVRSIRGKAPRCYIGDSSDQSRTEVKSLDEEFRRVLRAESLNPKFIQGMQKHGYKGAGDLASLVAHCYGWDATSEVMRDWMYEGLAEKLALDSQTQAWMKAVNPWALQRMAETLLEAQRRGLWQAKPETKAALEALYLEVEGELEDAADR